MNCNGDCNKGVECRCNPSQNGGMDKPKPVKSTMTTPTPAHQNNLT